MNTTLSSSAKVRLFLLVVLVFASGATIWAGFRNRPVPESPPTTPDEVLAELKAGNKRFQDSHRTRTVETRNDAQRRRELAKNPQRPIAAILTCSDSRVVGEFVFDQPFGRIFDASNAGNVVNGEVLRSLEFAVEQLHVPLIVVLGHTNCGARNPVADAERLLKESTLLREAHNKKEVGISVGVYDLESGEVKWLDFHDQK
jgi:carbonic anhydrase